MQLLKALYNYPASLNLCRIQGFLSLIDIHQNIARNIVSLRVSEDLFDDLTDDPEAWQTAQLLEMETKPKLFNSHQPIIDRPFEEAEWNTAIELLVKTSPQ